jgi:hypothetical protein
LKEIDVSNYV